MSTPDNTAKKSWFSRLPIVSHLRQSVGLQRGMLITGLILCGIVLICAIFAPLIAPYGFNQLGTSEGNFGSKLPPGGTHIWGTTVGGYDVFSRVVWGAQTAV
ncbi:MAG: ABC transporter permease, partial [Brevibacterium aurantiacum]|nr:ABC transporter permease [Brevibacterium aurantiacum]